MQNCHPHHRIDLPAQMLASAHLACINICESANIFQKSLELECWRCCVGFYKYFQWTSRVARMMMPPSFWRYLSHNGPFAVSDAQNLLSVSLLIAIGSCVSTFIGALQAELPWQLIQTLPERRRATHWLQFAANAMAYMCQVLIYSSSNSCYPCCAGAATTVLFCRLLALSVPC